MRMTIKSREWLKLHFKIAEAGVKSASMPLVNRIMECVSEGVPLKLPFNAEEGIPEVEDADELEDVLAGEVDLDDEDEEPYELEKPCGRKVFAIRVCQDIYGNIDCVPPYSDWGSIRPKDRLGRAILDAYNRRMQVYKKIGIYLTSARLEELRQGPNSLDLKLEQKAFLAQWLSSLDVDTADLSRFLNHCDLVWDDDLIPGGASMPIRALFQ